MSLCSPVLYEDYPIQTPTAPGCRRPPCDKTVPDDVVGYVHFRIVRYSFDLIPSPKPRVSDLHTAARQVD